MRRRQQPRVRGKLHTAFLGIFVTAFLAADVGPAGTTQVEAAGAMRGSNRHSRHHSEHGNLKGHHPHHAKGARPAHKIAAATLAPAPSSALGAPAAYSLGDRVLVHGNQAGTVRYVGRTAFGPMDQLVWYGVELDHAKGKNDGSINGVRYFRCKDQYGLFTLPKNVAPLPGEWASTTTPKTASSSALGVATPDISASPSPSVDANTPLPNPLSVGSNSAKDAYLRAIDAKIKRLMGHGVDDPDPIKAFVDRSINDAQAQMLEADNHNLDLQLEKFQGADAARSVSLLDLGENVIRHRDPDSPIAYPHRINLGDTDRELRRLLDHSSLEELPSVVDQQPASLTMDQARLPSQSVSELSEYARMVSKRSKSILKSVPSTRPKIPSDHLSLEALNAKGVAEDKWAAVDPLAASDHLLDHAMEDLETRSTRAVVTHHQ